jgi:hypothetical protein
VSPDTTATVSTRIEASLAQELHLQAKHAIRHSQDADVGRCGQREVVVAAVTTREAAGSHPCVRRAAGREARSPLPCLPHS